MSIRFTLSKVGRRHLLALGLCWAGLLLPATDALAGERILHVVSDDNYPPYLFRDADGQVQGYLVDYWEAVATEDRGPGPAQRAAMGRGAAPAAAGRSRRDRPDLPYASARTAVRLLAALRPAAGQHLQPCLDQRHQQPADAQGLPGRGAEGDACIDELTEQGINSLQPYDNYAALLAAARSGEIRVFCLDEAPANFYLYRLGAEQEFKKAFELYVGSARRAVRKGDDEKLALVLRGMQAISPEEDTKLRNKWFGIPLNPSDAAMLRYLRLGGGILVGIMLLLGGWVWTTRRVVKRAGPPSWPRARTASAPCSRTAARPSC